MLPVFAIIHRRKGRKATGINPVARQGQFRSEDRFDACALTGFLELDGGIEAVEIRKRDGRDAMLGCKSRQLLRSCQ